MTARKKMTSIKAQLIASVLLVELTAAVCGTGLAFLYERRFHFRVFDIMLRGRADSLLGAVQDAEDRDDNLMLDGTEVNLPHKDIYEVWDENLRVLGHSANWSITPDSAPVTEQPQQIEVDGRQYRTLRIVGARIVDPGDKGGGKLRHVTIVYGVGTHPVWEAVWRAVLFYGFTSIAIAAATGLTMFWLLRRGLAPLDELALQAAGVSVSSWEFQPSNRVSATVELAPLAIAIQTAMRGLERSFTQQHQFVSDAAHELKTAVAVVKSSLQLLMIKPRAARVYEVGLERLRDDCGRMEDIVAKMLMLAQAERDGDCDHSACANVGDVLEHLKERLASFSELRNVSVSVAVGDPEVSAGALLASIAPEDLELLLSNLMMNAIQHCRKRDAVRVTARNDGDWVENSCRGRGRRDRGGGSAICLR